MGSIPKLAIHPAVLVPNHHPIIHRVAFQAAAHQMQRRTLALLMPWLLVHPTVYPPPERMQLHWRTRVFHPMDVLSTRIDMMMSWEVM